MYKKFTKIKIGQIGVLDIKIPLIILGSGQPKGVVVANLHGRETSPILVIQKLLQELTDFKGQLVVLPSVNPFGLIQNTREEPIDSFDLNRIFPGSSRKNFSQRLAACIFSQISNADFVIDLHCFSQRSTPITAILIKNTDPKTSQQQKEMIKAFLPQIIWEIDPKNSNQGHAGALDIICNKQGIPAVSIEMPNLDLITDQEIQKVVTGIKNILAIKQMIRQSTKVNQIEPIPIYSVSYIYSDKAGLFIPTKPILDFVDKGSDVGRIYSLMDFSATNITSPKSGIITTISTKSIIRTGSKLFTVGKKVGEL